MLVKYEALECDHTSYYSHGHTILNTIDNDEKLKRYNLLRALQYIHQPAGFSVGGLAMAAHPPLPYPTTNIVKFSLNHHLLKDHITRAKSNCLLEGEQNGISLSLHPQKYTEKGHISAAYVPRGMHVDVTGEVTPVLATAGREVCHTREAIYDGKQKHACATPKSAQDT